MFISVVKNNDDDVFIFLELVFSFLIFKCLGVFFIYNLFKRFTFLLVNAENLSEGFSRDSCTGSQDLGECVSNSVAEAMIMEIKDMYHPALRVSDFFQSTGLGR